MNDKTKIEEEEIRNERIKKKMGKEDRKVDAHASLRYRSAALQKRFNNLAVRQH